MTAVNLQETFSAGRTTDEFIASMTRNQDKFVEWRQQFSWKHDEDREFFAKLGSLGLRCLIIAADWCGDVVRNVPVVIELMETAGIETRILVMEEHLDVMDRFLTMGGRSIPVVLWLDSAGDVIGRWGPRPRYVQEPMVTFKERYRDAGAEGYQEALKQTREEIMRRYGTGTDYQHLITDEIKSLFARLSD